MHALSIVSAPRFLSVVFSGNVTLQERREAIEAAVEAACAADIGSFLIDFSGATIAPYPVVEGIRHAWQVGQLVFLDRIAYVAPGQEDNLAIHLLRKARDTNVRVFDSQREARAWIAGSREGDGRGREQRMVQADGQDGR
ncbi:MAG: STAS/SEC14 domain-containing protein [Lysobacteraceae bacterium]